MTRAGRAPAARLLRARGWVGLTVLVIAAVVAGVVLLGGSSAAPLDPENPGPGGTRALAHVLADNHVQVTTVRSTQDYLDADAAGATVVVTRPQDLRAATLNRIRAGQEATLVLVDPGQRELTALNLPLTATSATTDGPIRCHRAPWRGLRLVGADHVYRPAGASGCFTADGGQVVAATGHYPRVVLLGSARVLQNGHILAGDNAAVALRVLGRNDRVVWFAASSESDPGGPASVWPAWVRPAVVVGAFTLVLLALWRGRRLGRLVPEVLPVIVPAGEVTRSRGLLYRKARDTTRAAAVLRLATRDRLTRYLGLGPSPGQQTVVQSVADASGRPRHEVDEVMFGPPPAGEAELNLLAQQLTTIERQVRPDADHPTP